MQQHRLQPKSLQEMALRNLDGHFFLWSIFGLLDGYIRVLLDVAEQRGSIRKQNSEVICMPA
jgi:hypothetical protein